MTTIVTAQKNWKRCACGLRFQEVADEGVAGKPLGGIIGIISAKIVPSVQRIISKSLTFGGQRNAW
jgi:hypothetical protein